MYNIQKKIASQHYAPLLYASSLNNIQKKIASIRLGAYGAKKNLTAWPRLLTYNIQKKIASPLRLARHARHPPL